MPILSHPRILHEALLLDQRFSGTEVTRITGATPRQLSYWARLGLVSPRARSGQRFFSFTDLVAVETLNRLTQKHIPMRRLRRAMDQLQAGLGEARANLSSLRISTYGARIVVHEPGPAGRPIEPLSGQWVLNFETVPLEKKVRALSARTAEEWFEMAMLCDANPKTLPRAVEAYRRAITAMPEWTDAHINLGTTLYEIGLLEESGESFAKAVELEPENALAHFNLGCVSDRLGNVPDAIEKFRTAVTLQPTMGDAHLNLALGYDKTARKEDALRHLALYLRYQPQGAWAAYARKRLNVQGHKPAGKVTQFRIKAGPQ